MATQFGNFEVELDLESGCLVVTNTDMKYQLNIGGDAIDILDELGYIIDQVELPV